MKPELSAAGAVDFPPMDESALVARAVALAPLVGSGGTIHLRGDLGAGKTTFARALLTALGVGERIKSPTYSLIESYRIADLAIHHLDLYRIADAGELEWLGLTDLSDDKSLFVIEWPERGARLLPLPDLILDLAHDGRRRRLSASAGSLRGADWLRGWLGMA